MVKQRLTELAKFDCHYDYSFRDEEANKVRLIHTQAVTLRADVWHEDFDTRDWLKARALSDEEWYVRRAAVQALARGWKDNPDTVAWLKTLTPPGKT
jgi:hypothetical protein